MARARLNFDFWNRHPTEVAADLIGCLLSVRDHEGSLCQARIVETEAYHHSEGACHAYSFRNREKSERVAHFFGPAGFSYVYLNYGIHKLLNVITGPDEDGSAVLVRAVVPEKGIATMRRNRNGIPDKNLCNGPGKLTQALAIDLGHNKINVCDRESIISFHGRSAVEQVSIDHGPRVGISKATDLKWRFTERGSRSISKAKENGLLQEFFHN